VELDVRSVGREEAAALLAELAEVHLDAIRSGSAMGFVEPVDPADLDRHWRETAAELDGEERVLVVAWAEGRVVGTAQLERSRARNARHRAEVQRVAVTSRARGRGAGRALMSALEEIARSRGITLLYLTTHDDVPAARFYERVGWTKLGVMPGYSARPDGSLAPGAFYYRVLD
jgi:GNAT superfamily N-acetyltransferase